MASSARSVSFSVEGRTAIVTGSGSGINLAFASLLLSKNCNVLFADLALRPEAQRVVDDYSTRTEGRPRAMFQATDVADWKQLQGMFDVAQREFGDVDIVCPGAGVFEPHWSNFWLPPGSKQSKDALDSNRYRTLDINLTHPIRTTQLAISFFLDPPSGKKASVTNPKRIIHISSIAGQRGSLPIPLYCASKHAISGFIRSLADLEEPLGIRVNGVAPGIIETPLWKEHPEKLKMIDEKTDKFASAEEVAEAMLHCVESDEYPGGTVLEIGHKYTRKVSEFNDPGPSGEGISVSNGATLQEEVFEWLAQENWGK